MIGHGMRLGEIKGSVCVLFLAFIYGRDVCDLRCCL
jgi:hypothetical protein